MSVGKAIYYLLSNYSDLTDIVSTRIYPEVAEQDAAMPFVIYTVVSNEPSDTQSSPSQLDIAQVDIVLFSTDYSQVVDMGVAARAALDRVTGTYNGVNVQSCQYTSEVIDFEEYPRAYVITQSYDVRINRDEFEIVQGTPVSGADIIDLKDTPSDYGTTGQALVVNAAGDGMEWGETASDLGDLRDVADYDPATLQDKTSIRWDAANEQWALVPATGRLPDVITYFLNRYDAEANTARQLADATLTIERYVTVQADGHGEDSTAQTDTPSSGNKIVRKIWHKATAFEDSDVTTWTVAHTFADDTAYLDTIDTFQALLTAATYGSVPLTLAQTWEDVAAAVGPLDIVPGAAIALSAARLLDSTYTGDAIRVRRASDNAEQDIGFDASGELDTSALATFCAGTDGFVTTWYDQSGNGNDATQGTTASQWKIYDSSTGVQLRSSVVTINRAASTAILGSVNIGTVGQPIQFFCVQAVDAGTGTARAWRTASSSINLLIREVENDILLSAGTALISSVISPAPDNGELRLSSGLINSTSSKIHFDGAEVASGDAGTNTINSDVHLGGLATAQLIDAMSEFILYPSDQSANRAAIEANINAFYNIY